MTAIRSCLPTDAQATRAVRLAFSAGTLTLEGLTDLAVRRVFPNVPWVRDSRSSQWRCDAMHYRVAKAQLNKLAANYADDVARWVRIRWPRRQLHALRDEQSAAVKAWLATNRQGTIVMPTGTGKTEVALAIMADEQASTLVVAPLRELMYQWHQRILAAFGVDAGIIGDNVYRVSPVSVTTYDSALIHMPRLGNQFELVIFDECHHLPGPLRRDAARMSAATSRLGLTATLRRSDGAHEDLEELIGPLAYELPMSAARGHLLAPYDVVRIPVRLTKTEQARYARLSARVRMFLAALRRTKPQADWKEVCGLAATVPEAQRALAAFHARKAIEDRAQEKLRVLQDLFRLHAGEPVIVFTGTNAMARDVSRRFLIPCLLSHCGKRERREVLQGLQHGTYPALVANRVLDEGVDLPEVKTAVVLGGMGSSRQAQQRLGRVLRRRDNQRATLYEVVAEKTAEIERSRQRRRCDAYQKTRHRRI